MIDLSIIILSFNTKDLILQCIESIKKSKPKIKYEIIVVDNGSTDGSIEALRKLHAANYKLLINKVNLGFSKASNRGVKKAKGKYILLLNSDTKIEKGTIDKLYGFAKKTPDAGVVVPKLLNSNGSVQASVFKFFTIGRVIKQYWLGKKELLDGYAPKGDRPEVVETAVMAVFLITPKALKKVGLLDENFFIYFEDLDYCRRVHKAGLKVYYLPTAKVVHHHGASGKKLVKKSDQWRRLVPSSKIYHGKLKHYLLTAIMWSGQKWQKSWWLKLMLILMVVPTFVSLLRPGFFPMQDDLQAFRIHQMDKCVQDFQIPCRWVPDAGYQYGYPQFNYYSPGAYYLGELFHLFGFQFIDSVKILFILGYLFSAIAMFVLVETLVGSWPAFVAAVLYTYVPYKAVEVYVRGAMSEFWTLALFPLIFWASYSLIKTGKRKYLIWFSIAIGLLTIVHNLMPIIFLPIAGLWILYWLFIEKKWFMLKKVIAGGLLGLGLASFFILPLAFERGFVHVWSMLSGYFDYRQHFVDLKQLFLLNNWGYGSSELGPGDDLNLSTGIVHWTIGLLAALLAYINRKKNKKVMMTVFFLFVLEVGVLFLMHMRSSFVWQIAGILKWLQFPWRFMVISIFLLSLLAGYAVFLAKSKKYLLGIVAILMSVILYVGFFQPKEWLDTSDKEKFTGASWEKQLTISIFDYTPIYAELPPPTKAPDLPEVLDGQAEFLEYKKGSNFQEGIIKVEENAIIRLPLFDFPGMRVTINGKEIEHRHDDCRDQEYCLGLITFNVPVGEHEIKARLTNTLIRNIGNTVSIISFVVLAGLVWQKRKK